MNKKASIKIAIVCLVIAALACPGLVFAADKGITVIGKATVKKGTVLSVLVSGRNSGAPLFGTAKAFEDQELYIVNKFSAKPGVHLGGYTLDGEGFAHDCPTHGEEVIGPSIILLPIELVETGEVTIELF